MDGRHATPGPSWGPESTEGSTTDAVFTSGSSVGSFSSFGTVAPNDAEPVTADAITVATADGGTLRKPLALVEDPRAKYVSAKPPIEGALFDDRVPLAFEIAIAEKVLKGEDRVAASTVELNGRVYEVVCLYDGHGGRFAVDFCAANMISLIVDAASKVRCGGATLEGVADAVTTAFAIAHQHVRSQAKPEHATSGSTATVVFCDPKARTILCANVGDSSMLVVDNENAGFATTEHCLHLNEAEQRRVQEAGARIAHALHPVTSQPTGRLRMFPGGIGVSRAIGDADCGLALIPTPSIDIMQLPVKGAVLLLCSNGIWDALGLLTAASTVRRHNDPHVIAKKLVAEALQNRGLRDDTTCIVIKVGKGFGSRLAMPSLFHVRPRSRISAPKSAVV
mmetsp:Transcript_25677/g.65255  ORF Transcript_25677/g.65255 Transcript_25677/m.65255 type:complete len:394 (-) Transcript_25677:225-1406(-)